MSHRRLSCALAAVLAAGLLWPSGAAAQRPRPRPPAPSGGHAVSRSSHAVRPPYYRYPRTYYSYYPGYYPYSWNWGLYWGWGYPGYWYSPYYYGAYGYPYWHGYYGPWGYPYPYQYYYDDNHASVRVQASPREAQVYVDGYFVGIVDDFDGTFQRLRVPPGGHEITLHLQGYRNASQKIYLQPHATYHLKTRLEPLPAGAPQDPPPAPDPNAAKAYENRPEMEGPPAEPEPQGPPSHRWPPREQAEERRGTQGFGTLSLRVQPPDAEVLVDGTPWTGAAGEDGVLAVQVSAGTHRVEVRREGFISYVADVNIRANVAMPLNVMLQREN